MFDLGKFLLSLTFDEIALYIYRSSQQALLLIGPGGRIHSCSPSFSRAVGKTQTELAGQTISQALGVSETIQQIYGRYESREKDRPLPTIKLRIVDDEYYESGFMVTSLQSDKDHHIYHVLQLVNVTEENGLNLLQQFAGTFMKDVNLGVILIDTDFRLINISDMACRVLGLEKKSIMNRPMDEVFASIPVEHQLVQRTILDGMIVRNHAVSWTNNQDRYELLLDSNLLRDHNGQIVGAYIMFKDVTNLRSLEEQVQRSDRLAMIGQIAAGAAHEIRNPLTSIKGFMQVLKSTFIEKGMDKEKAYTEIMLTEINRINELVSEFLLLSKRKNVSLDRVEIRMVLKEILPIINSEALLHGVSVQHEQSLALPVVIADTELLKQVFLNICKNGIEAMSEGGILTITERVDYEDSRVHIEIHDTGPGIPAFLIDKIFDPFFTTKESGTGLGLSVCQRIIHDMGGTIRVASKGFGTTFSVCIPFH